MTTQRAEGYEPQFTLGDKLRRIRRDHNLQQDAFAEMLGVTAKAYGAWESGTNTPRGDTLIEIARRVEALYGQTARDWLLGFGAAPTPPPSGREPARRGASTLADLTEAKRARTGRNAGGLSTGRYLAAAA